MYVWLGLPDRSYTFYPILPDPIFLVTFCAPINSLLLYVASLLKVSGFHVLFTILFGGLLRTFFHCEILIPPPSFLVFLWIYLQAFSFNFAFFGQCLLFAAILGLIYLKLMFKSQKVNLKEWLMNQSQKQILKDKFSSASYHIWWTYQVSLGGHIIWYFSYCLFQNFSFLILRNFFGIIYLVFLHF